MAQFGCVGVTRDGWDACDWCCERWFSGLWMLDFGVRAGVIAVALDAAVGSWSARPGLARISTQGVRHKVQLSSIIAHRG